MGSPSLIGGHPLNEVVAGLSGGTIGGGGGGSGPNLVHSQFSTIGGGYDNQAGVQAANSSDYATVSGGESNTASGRQSSVAGGSFNIASGDRSIVGGGVGNQASGADSTVGGGTTNSASGVFSTVPGGYSNWAGGAASVAMGYRAIVLPNAGGSFVFSDSTNADFTSGTANEFLVGATGGIGLYTSKAYTTYCRLNPGGGSWDCSSSREVKRDFGPVDTRDALEKVASLSLSSWRFMNEPEGVRHLGPMAEDFRAAFGLGSDERSISSVDAQGVALAAIQGLNAKLDAQAARMAQLEARLAELESLASAGRQEPASASASRVSR